jgi:hypothetical protein
MSFKPKKIEEPQRPSSAEIAATVGNLRLIPTTPSVKAEPSLMMSFKASKSFAKTLAEAAEPEGGLRRLIARVFHEAGYPVPDADLRNTKRRRTYD